MILINGACNLEFTMLLTRFLKMKKLNLSITLLFFLFALGVIAQNNTQSPYSKLGLGDFQSMGFGRSAAMGGVGYALYSGNELNHLNPASLSNLDSLLSVLEIGMHADNTHLENATTTDSRWTANVTHVSFGMAVNKRWGMSYGIAPYTSVGYNITTDQEVSGIPQKYSVLLKGKGGLNNLYWSNGFKITPNISLGVNISYLFGPKTEEQYYDLTDITAYTISRKISDKYRGWKFDLGYQQTASLSSNSKLTIGIIANLPGILKRKTTDIVIQGYSSFSDDTLKNEENVKSNLNFPMNVGGGISYQYKQHLTLAADYTFIRFSDFKIDDSFSELIDNHVFALGLEYFPHNSGMRKRNIKYRTGANYQTGYYLVDGNELKSMKITAGIGFPVKATLFNIYGSYGGRGFLKDNLIKENTLSFGINMSFMDLWFRKRQIE